MYDGIGSEGTYPVELTAEDFPRQTVTLTAEPWMQEIHPYNASGAKRSKALSSVPLQFTLTGKCIPKDIQLLGHTIGVEAKKS